ncbi:hypothetical protein [Corynebacterium urinipleomorphum]|uniref:hypothetical protein n=1 Tax=Corynebacterium urinipleomorphum TaxID=1852380 RepID=UPI000B36004D|nr:hypothetical protein [Corynebacterium urinipleomorphum]
MTDSPNSPAGRYASFPGAADHAAAQERMRHVPEQVEPDAPLPQGNAGDAYPVNEQHLEDFNVGGVERSLPPQQQLDQLVSYMESSYPVPDAGDSEALDRYLAALPDRLTHAAMLMLGSGLDHTMPGVAYGMGVEIQDVPGIGARVFAPAGGAQASPTGPWAVSSHPGFGPRSLEHYWRPLVAAVAQLSGVTIVDIEDPNEGSVSAALEFIAKQEPSTTAVLAMEPQRVADQYSVNPVDAAPLLYPADGYAASQIGDGPGIIATPEEFRRIVRDTAQKLSGA